MAGRTDFITDARWEDVWTIWYTLVDDAYQTLEQHYGAWRRSGPQPLFSDSEAITVGLIIDTWFGGHEALGLSFLRQYHPTLFPHLPPQVHQLAGIAPAMLVNYFLNSYWTFRSATQR